MGCDASSEGIQTLPVGFNPRTRVGCDDTSTDNATNATKFQSTHPRGVRPISAGLFFVILPVSIHAPAWGATVLESQTTFYSPKFQSTHPRGVRRANKVRTGATSGFQSTHPRGVRLMFDFLKKKETQVSIHAPAWGATSTVWWLRAVYRKFQSTHPRGVRREEMVKEVMEMIVSIHAPAWGATPHCDTGR